MSTDGKYLLTYSPTHLHLPTHLLTYSPTHLLTYSPESDGFHNPHHDFTRPAATVDGRIAPLAELAAGRPAGLVVGGAARHFRGGASGCIGSAAVGSWPLRPPRPYPPRCGRSYFPVTFEVTSSGLRRLALGRLRLIPWQAIRAYQPRQPASSSFNAPIQQRCTCPAACSCPTHQTRTNYSSPCDSTCRTQSSCHRRSGEPSRTGVREPAGHAARLAAPTWTAATPAWDRARRAARRPGS